MNMEERVLFKVVGILATLWSVIMYNKTAGEVTLRDSYEGTNCPGTIITYTCTAFETDILQWTITLSGGQSNTNIFNRFMSSPGATQEFQLIRDKNVELTLIDVRGNTMLSTLTTALSRELDQAEVTCSSIDGNFIIRASDSAMISVADVPSAPQSLTATSVLPLSTSVHVRLNWEHSFHFQYPSPFPDREYYIITTDPPTITSSTPITSTTIELQYDVKYNVSVIATNCVGESDTAKLQLGPYSSELLWSSPSDYTTHTDTPTGIQTTPPDQDTDLPQSEPSPPFNIAIIIAVVVGVGVVIVVVCLAAAVLVIATIIAMQRRRRGHRSKAPELERQQASGSLYSEVIHPVQNVAYSSIPFTPEQTPPTPPPPPPPLRDGCDEAGYEVIADHSENDSESILTASYSYAEASADIEYSTVSYLNIIS